MIVEPVSSILYSKASSALSNTVDVLLFNESSDNLLATKIDKAINDNFHNVEINRKAFIDLFDLKVVSKELYELITAN